MRKWNFQSFTIMISCSAWPLTHYFVLKPTGVLITIPKSLPSMPLPESDFAIFGLRTRAVPPTLAIKRKSLYSYFGRRFDLRHSLTEFDTWSTGVVIGNVREAFTDFMAHAHAFLEENAADFNSYWVSVRATTATDEFDIPRWHTDVTFFVTRPVERT